jgi:hypothetical protein
MKSRFSIAVTVLLGAVVFAGCGRNRDEVEREHQRLEAQKQSEREIQRANKAIGEIGKKIGRKVAPLGLLIE